jgi:hypothetical protein
MMSGDECRAKVKLAQESARSAPDSKVRVTWTELAHEWLKLGRLADAHEAIEYTLVAKDPNSAG